MHTRILNQGTGGNSLSGKARDKLRDALDALNAIYKARDAMDKARDAMDKTIEEAMEKALDFSA